jgi:hypothetical protein
MFRVLFGVALALSLAPQAAGDTPLTQDQIEAFMRSAKVVAARNTSTGVTRPARLTLSNGGLTHDALFQAVDERKPVMQFPNGTMEANFVDSWRYNVAAYRLAGLLGLADMMPVTIEYRFRGRTGSLAWWMDSLMDEGERLKRKVEPPDRTAWNNDMFRQRVFMELVYDTDRNLSNVLVSPQWRVIMIDFTRAFRLWDTVRAAELHRIDRRLLERLEALSPDEVTRAAESHLTPGEIDAVMKRRDLIVAHYRARVKQLGEVRVLY